MAGIPKLAGMRDLSERDALGLRRAAERLQDFLASWGYTLVDTPLLERTDLFLRKSGGELAAKMYTFTDPGGHQVSLRPEFTSSVIRSFVEQGCPDPFPWRWQYAGPVFRYEESRHYHQFTQVGAELVGSDQPSADAEVLALALRGLHALGFSPLTLALGDVSALTGFLDQFPLSERAKLFLLSNISRLNQGGEAQQRVVQRAQELGLLSRLPEGPEGEGEELIQVMEGALGKTLLQSFLGETLANPVGSRSQEEILSRYLQRLKGSDDPGQLQRAMGFLGELCRVEGEPPWALEQAERLAAEHRLDSRCLEGLRRVLEVLAHYKVKDAQVVLDFGLTREIAYYTGVVFEVRLRQLASQGLSLCGGGRYNGLIKALGGKRDVPALGFAYSLEELLAALPAQADGRDISQRDRNRVMVAPQDPAAYQVALQVAETLRLGGEWVELDLEGRGINENLAYARGRGIGAVVTVEPDGRSQRWWVDEV